MVLGVKFLRTLGPILWDFDDLCMSFWHFDKRVLWKGIGSTRWDIPPTGRVHAMQHSESELLENLLHMYSQIRWDYLHNVVVTTVFILKAMAEPVAVRPYRYPQLQKDELDVQCKTMLEQGIIQPSTSPFSAPVLLVKKQGGSW